MGSKCGTRPITHAIAAEPGDHSRPTNAVKASLLRHFTSPPRCRPNDAGRLATDTVTSASVGQLGGFLGVVGRIAGVKGTEPLIVGATRVAASQLLAATTRWL